MTLMLETYTEENTIGDMGICGVVIHPEVRDRIEDCIASLEYNEDFDVNDVLAYLHEIYGGPLSGPMQWVTAGNLENVLETHFCPTYSGAQNYKERVGIQFSYDWMTYETAYWRVR